MQFQKKKAGNLSTIGKLFIKLFLICLVIFIAIILIEKIDFPAPSKKIQETISNENFKIVK